MLLLPHLSEKNIKTESPKCGHTRKYYFYCQGYKYKYLYYALHGGSVNIKPRD